ncbi:hypothetical protein BJY00DRAFT_299683 [Aspergillus carlsbadensis]|nr:hypothetical protein BJY00DRAFT_299683 [Aspergillus carlsbadensis]
MQNRQPESTFALADANPLLIIGAGFGGLLFAIRLIQSGTYTAQDIILLDMAGGFGGTWYWNRYPGVMCDVESFIHMPLLEETGYVPTRKYVSGEELRGYAERLAEGWGLARRGLFRATLRALEWDEGCKRWSAYAQREDSQASITLQADMVILASGPFSGPQAPEVPGLEGYKGGIFHTARWNYDITGGPAENPAMEKLRDKTVGILGTGASAVQVVRHLAAWAKELIVFQRTPSSVDWRDNSPTTAESWKEVSAEPGWQCRRMKNFNSWTSNADPLPDEDLVGDAWTTMPSFSVLIGGPGNLQNGYLGKIHARDHARQARIRDRVSHAVSSRETAELLQAWYPGWCKRPCFHAEYLAAFNRPNVKLVDVRNTGISRFTANGIMVGEDTEYPLDVVVLGTGLAFSGSASPAEKARITVLGRGGRSMHRKWATAVATLHGVVSRDFPNLFYPGPHQIGVCANQMYVLDQLSSRVAYIISAARGRARPGTTVTIEPTAEAEERWAEKVVSRAGAMAGLVNCTPGYYNNDGEIDKPRSVEELMNAARLATWGDGIADYIRVLEEWRSHPELCGLE